MIFQWALVLCNEKRPRFFVVLLDFSKNKVQEKVLIELLQYSIFKNCVLYDKHSKDISIFLQRHSITVHNILPLENSNACAGTTVLAGITRNY